MNRILKVSIFTLIGLAVFIERIVFGMPTLGPRAPTYEENISITRHNLSSIWPQGNNVPAEPLERVFSNATTELCVFCHTPHAAAGDGPLWNRNFSDKDYDVYKPMGSIQGKVLRGSMDAVANQPGGYSKLCLSCHDGSIAIGAIRNAPGAGGFGGALVVQNTHTDGTMPRGSGELSGDTRLIGIDLRNDHPVSFNLLDQGNSGISTVATIDGELHPPSLEPGGVWESSPVAKLYPLGFTGEKTAVQCTSCHNPHSTAPKFLRGNRYNIPLPGGMQICLSCHAMPEGTPWGSAGDPKIGWVGSTHEISSFPYRANAPDGQELIDLEAKYPGFNFNTVAVRGCLNCHDMHTVLGADRLHRNGADADGGMPAIENTCFQCHMKSDGSEFIPNLPDETPYVNAPDIKTQFDKQGVNGNEGAWNSGGGTAMPLSTNWNGADTNGIHQPEFISQKTLYNRGDESNAGGHDNATSSGQVLENYEERVLNAPIDSTLIHVECVDCHNPHQVNRENRMRGMKAIRIDGEVIGGDSGTGSLSPMPGTDFYIEGRLPDNDTGRTEPLIYEVCFRCHGDSFAFNMPYIAFGSRPLLGSPANELRHRGHNNSDYGMLGAINSILSGHYNGQTQRWGASNKRKEFDPSTPALTRTSTESGFSSDNRSEYVAYNTSYHPVAAPGRNGTTNLCIQLQSAFNLDCSSTAAAAGSLKNLTIQCTDCHNNDAFSGTIIGPVTGLQDGTSYMRGSDKASNLTLSDENDIDKPQGPHGSSNRRVLRATYDTRLGEKAPTGTDQGGTMRPDASFALCFLCHDKDKFLGGNTNFGGPGVTTIGSRDWSKNLHLYHLVNAEATCHECHNNVHSNVEANNTIYGDGTGNLSWLPPDAHDGLSDGFIDTHLLNFGPQAEGDQANYPNWYYNSSTQEFRCNLKCHGVTMTACAYYVHDANAGQSGTSGRGGNSTWACGSEPTDW